MHAAGYAFARGECTSHSNPIIGLSSFFSAGGGASDDDPLYWALWLFSWVFAAVSVTIPSGALAERCQFRAYLIYTFWQTGLIYPLVVHWVWSHEVCCFQSGKFSPCKGRGLNSTLLVAWLTMPPVVCHCVIRGLPPFWTTCTSRHWPCNIFG